MSATRRIGASPLTRRLDTKLSKGIDICKINRLYTFICPSACGAITAIMTAAEYVKSSSVTPDVRHSAEYTGTQQTNIAMNESSNISVLAAAAAKNGSAASGQYRNITESNGKLDE